MFTLFKAYLTGADKTVENAEINLFLLTLSERFGTFISITLSVCCFFTVSDTGSDITIMSSPPLKSTVIYTLNNSRVNKSQ
ncbi:hypothetical protein BH09PAT1_BH09PAT1_0300 [soil metagenome]